MQVRKKDVHDVPEGERVAHERAEHLQKGYEWAQRPALVPVALGFVNMPVHQENQARCIVACQSLQDIDINLGLKHLGQRVPVVALEGFDRADCMLDSRMTIVH